MAENFSEAELENLSDESLMQLVQGGDEQALVVLFNRYKKKNKGFFKNKLRLEQKYMAEDMVGLLWLRIVESVEQYNPDRGLFRTWMGGIARKVWSQFWRDELGARAVCPVSPEEKTKEYIRPHPKLKLRSKENGDDDNDDETKTLLDERTQTEDEVLSELSFQEMLSWIPEKYRDVLMLRYQENLRWVDIARVLGIHVNKAKSIWRSAWVELGREMQVRGLGKGPARRRR